MRKSQHVSQASRFLPSHFIDPLRVIVLKLDMAQIALIAILILTIAPSAWADVYKYVDEAGVVKLTDVPLSGNIRQNLERKYKIKGPSYYVPPTRYMYPEASLWSSSARADQYRSMIDDHASRHSLDPKLLEAVIKTESNFNSQAVSNKGAIGLMQLMPSTAYLMGVDNPRDPEQNIAGGSRYLRSMLERFNGDLTLALAAYNAGPVNVEKYGTVPPFAETQNYIRRIYSLYRGEKKIKDSTVTLASAKPIAPAYVKQTEAPAAPPPRKENIYKVVLADGTVLYTNSAYTGSTGNRAR